MRELVLLGRDLALGVLAAITLVVVLDLAGLRVSPFLPIAVCLAGATGFWYLRLGLTRADASSLPELDTDPGDSRPDARDLRVRRLEAAAVSAQPSRKITARAIGLTLGEIAEERSHREDALPLSESLDRFIREAAEADADAHPVRPVDRRTLHAYLRELAASAPRPASQEDRP